MLYYRIEQIDKDLKENVLLSYHQHKNINEILLDSSLMLNEVLAILKYYKIPDYELASIVSAFNLLDDQVIIISDTHIGNQKENILYLKYVYDFAFQNNINSIIHTGDLLQSTLGYPKIEFQAPISQINRTLEVFPYYPNINTYILFGNHDLHLLKKNPSYIEELKKRSDFKILGLAKAYINWQNNLITVSHRINKYNLQIPNLSFLMNFIGHRHSLKLYNNHSIAVPTLSDDLKIYEGYESKPGFLIATIKDNKLVIETIDFEKESLNRQQIFQKDIEESSIETKKMIL